MLAFMGFLCCYSTTNCQKTDLHHTQFPSKMQYNISFLSDDVKVKMKSRTHSYYMCRCVSKLHLITWVIPTAVWIASPGKRAHSRQQTHQYTLAVLWIALAGTHTSISIWKPAAGRCSCHCCWRLLVMHLDGSSSILANPYLTVHCCMLASFLCTSSCLSVMRLVFCLISWWSFITCIMYDLSQPLGTEKLITESCKYNTGKHTCSLSLCGILDYWHSKKPYGNPQLFPESSSFNRSIYKKKSWRSSFFKSGCAALNSE